MSLLGGVSAGLGGAGGLGTLFIRLTANSSDLVRGFDQAETKVDRSTTAMAKRVGQFSVVVATALAGVAAAAVREFAVFESSFAGVRKTIDATEAEYREMARTFRDMAKVMPTNVNEINRVAEAAGSLGIQKNNLKEFTKTMIDMGNTTNLSSDEAATQMARFANITRMAQTDFTRLGSTIVDLGNKLATTEAEIMAMGLRLAGAGKQVGMTEPQILALAGALSSVGVEAEAGGTAMSQLMIKMAQASAQGSAELAIFGNVAGMTADEFKQAFEKDAANAILTFLQGVDRLNAEGQDVFTVLESMGIEGTRLIDVTTRAAGAQKLFNEALGIGKKAWEENTALTEEARKRNETFAAQVQITANLFRELAITIGEGLAPAVKEINADLQEMMNMSGSSTEMWKQLGATIGSTLRVVIKGASMITIGLNNAFKFLGIVILDTFAYVPEGLDKMLDGIKYIAESIVKSFSWAFNKVIDGVNFLIENIPAPVRKMMGMEAGMEKNFFPEMKFDLNLPRSSFLKETAALIRSASDELASDLERQVFPAVELKRTMEEVREDMAAAANESERQAKAMQDSAAAAAQQALNQERAAAALRTKKENDKLLKSFESMPDAKSINRGMGYGFGFGNSELSAATGLNMDRQETEDSLKVLEEIQKRELSLTEEQREKMLAVHQAYHERLRRIKQAEYELAIVSAQSMFGDLASIAEAFAGKQSGIYKAMFAASKAFAIAESIIKIQQGIASAAAIPWPANLAAIASVVAATANIVSTIQSVKLEFAGARAAGGAVTAGKAYLVGERGPELFVPQGYGDIVPNDELEGSSSPVRVVVHNYTDARPEVTERNDNGERVVEVVIRRVKGEIAGEIREGRGPVASAIEKSFALRRAAT